MERAGWMQQGGLRGEGVGGLSFLRSLWDEVFGETPECVC